MNFLSLLSITNLPLNLRLEIIGHIILFKLYFRDIYAIRC